MRLDETPVRLLGKLGVHVVKRHDRMSIHGESCQSGAGSSGLWKISSAQIICIQVVPVLRRVLITMSPGR